MPLTETEQRSNIYNFLAAIYRQELNAEFLQQIKEPRFTDLLSDMGIQFEEDLERKPEEELLEDLAMEYTRLFLGPGKHISPHESIHHQRDDGKWGQLWGLSTADVKNFIQTAGFQHQPNFKGLPDHISVEFEFMGQVAWREAQALKEEDKDGVRYCRDIQKQFIRNHLIRWIPAFCKLIIEEAELSFYRAMAELTRNFIEYENDAIEHNGDSPS